MKKLNAGSLQLVTFIIVIISLLLGSFLLLIHLHKQYSIKTNHIVSISKNLNNSFFSDTRSNSTYVELDQSLGENEAVELDSTYWGVFKMVKAEAKINNSRLSKTALIGNQYRNENTALYLADQNSPLVMVGHSSIIGDAFIPQRGVKTGNISGQSYYGEEFIKGNESKSDDLPSIPRKLESHLDQLLLFGPDINEDYDTFKLQTGLNLSNSFQNKTKLFYSRSEINFSNMGLVGRLIIKSARNITIDASTNLEDVILIAPKIEIKNGFTGTIQAIATETLKVEENVLLKYPSALVLKKDFDPSGSNSQHQLLVERNALLKGVVLVLGRSHIKNYDVQLKIDNGSQIEGEVYCSQNFELQGSVNGIVYTNNFLVKHNGTTYQNHLLNGRINIQKRSKQYVSLFNKNGSKGIIKWMY